MATITIPDLFSTTAPYDRLPSPTVTAADVTITIDGVTTPNTNPPVVNTDGSVSIALTDAEYVDGAVVKLTDADGEWGSVEVFIVDDGESIADSIDLKKLSTNKTETHLKIIRGDSYGVTQPSNQALAFDATGVNNEVVGVMTVADNGQSLFTATGEVIDGELLIKFFGSETQNIEPGRYPFDVQVAEGVSRKTIARGLVCLIEDITQ